MYPLPPGTLDGLDPRHERSVGSVGPVPVRTYTARRFWEAGVLSLASLQTGMQWMAYSPIQDQVQHAYGWPASSFPLFAAYGPLLSSRFCGENGVSEGTSRASIHDLVAHIS